MIGPLPLSLDEFPQLRSPAVFGVPHGHLVGDPSGRCEISPFQIVLRQGLEVVHVVRFELDGPAQSHFGLLVFAQEIVEDPEVVVHPRPVRKAAGGERQVLFGLDVFLFLSQQQPQRVLNVVQLRIGLDRVIQQGRDQADVAMKAYGNTPWPIGP